MKKKIILLIVLILPIAAISGFSQENMTQLYDSAFKSHLRPPAVFQHDRHNDQAKIFDCGVCHHVYDKGHKVEGATSEDRKCAECHYKEDDMSLASAYHNRCKGCHIEKKAGPILCGECHQK
jgi:hypothetical protein